MNGVIVLSTRSGACLFARAFREDFGLPGGWDTHGDGQSVSPTGRSFGAMQLAGLIFALDLNARELQGDRPDPDPDPGVAAPVGVPTFAEGADARPGLVRWAVGDCALHFRKDHARQVMVVVFAAASFGDDTPGALADALLRGFVAKHAEHLEGFGGPSKTLKFERETHAAALDVPVAIAEKIRRAAGFESGWVYAALSRQLAADAAAEREWHEDAGPDDGDWDGDGDGDGDPSDARARPRGRRARPRAGGRVGVGARSGVSFAEDGEGNGAPSGVGGGGWFCFGRAAARRVRLAGSADAGAVQFVHRVRAAEQSSESTTGGGSSGARETLSEAALEGLAATIHAAAEAMAFAPGEGNARGLRTLELTIKGDADRGADRGADAGVDAVADAGAASSPAGGGEDDGSVRVFVFVWERFALAIPAQTVGVWSTEPAATARGRVAEHARALRRALRFVEHVVPEANVAFRSPE
jgi:hypothetical protein